MKIAKVSTINKKASNLFKGSVFPASVWGHPAVGIPKTQVNALEKEALNAVGASHTGRCRTTALLLHFGRYSNPYASIIKETFFYWFKLLPKIIQAGHLPSLRVAWEKAFFKAEFPGHCF